MRELPTVIFNKFQEEGSWVHAEKIKTKKVTTLNMLSWDHRN